jgi:hypothetical protein
VELIAAKQSVEENLKEVEKRLASSILMISKL